MEEILTRSQMLLGFIPDDEVVDRPFLLLGKRIETLLQVYPEMALRIRNQLLEHG